MNAIFPFDLPGSTAFYILVFVATLVVHFFFMSYVLAGMIWVVAGMFVLRERRSEIADLLKDWMPFMLSGAITAGVAPLLFIQILYRQQFYTANLLQFHRWMMILPVLIVLFYLLYVVKAAMVRTGLKQLAAVLATACVLFVAWSWSGNHVLSLEEPNIWHAVYASAAVPRSGLMVGLRLALWIAMTFPVLGGILMWQFADRRDPNSTPPGVARTAAIGLCGLLVSLVLVLLLGTRLSLEVRSALMTSPGIPWLVVAAAGWFVECSGWMQRFRRRNDTAATRWIVTIGILIHLTGIMMCRELVRVVTLGHRVDFAGHADAATSGGLWLFLVFCVVNAMIAGWCMRLVRRETR